MESNLEPIYEAYERLKMSQLEGDTQKEKRIMDEISKLRREFVEESKFKGSSTFFYEKTKINLEILNRWK